ncbi:nuclear transport factor 2 family protein [Streptosporangium sp. KLBMP 9127]|nr:nuclear transport factor 2 family protein [Streptosporangium sp. KLBMP 9127]
MKIRRIVVNAIVLFIVAGAMAMPGTPAHAGDSRMTEIGDQRPALGTRSAVPRRADSCSQDSKRIIRQAFDAWRRGTGSITDVFAPDIVWRIEGRSLASKVYRGKKQFMDEVMAPFVARFNRSPNPFRPTLIHDLLCDDDTVVVYWSGRGVANDGKTYENSYAWFMKMREGKVVNGVAFYESISFNELWTRVPPRQT